MKDKLRERMDALKAEFEQGEKMMAEQQRKQAELRDTLLRISGAIQVLEEALEPEEGDADGAGGGDEAPVLDLPPRPETLAAD